MNHEKLFHVSEDGGIKKFLPRPLAQAYDGIKNDVVFALTEKLLHNYLFPRDCPRVTYYKKQNSSLSDVERFFGKTSADYIIAVEEKWHEIIQRTSLYVYEFSPETFTLLDQCAGYYISYEPVAPVSVKQIDNPLTELSKRKNIELRFLPSLNELAGEVVKTSLNYSIIRMKNAAKEK